MGQYTTLCFFFSSADHGIQALSCLPCVAFITRLPSISNVGVNQGSALFSVIFALCVALILVVPQMFVSVHISSLYAVRIATFTARVDKKKIK